jgi:hypothetical protein
MSNFSFIISQTVEDFFGGTYQVNRISIRIIGEKFFIPSRIPFVSVFDNNNTVVSFVTQFSPNQIDMLGYFTSDAFNNFLGNVTITFGFGYVPLGKFENVDINNVIQPLDPLLASLNAPFGDNAWLNSLS